MPTSSNLRTAPRRIVRLRKPQRPALKDAFLAQRESRAAWLHHERLYAEESASEARRLMELPPPERKREFAEIGPDLADQDQARVLWTLERTDDVPALGPVLDPSADTFCLEGKLAAITNPIARGVREVLALAGGDGASDVSFLLRQLVEGRLDVPPFPRQRMTAQEFQDAVRDLVGVFSSRLLVAEEGVLLSRLSHHEAIEYLRYLAPSRPRGGPATQPSILDRLYDGGESMPERYASLPKAEDRRRQAEIFLRHVPALFGRKRKDARDPLALGDDVDGGEAPIGQAVAQESALREAEEVEIHQSLLRAKEGPALGFLAEWLCRSPRLHFPVAAAWREHVERSVAEASLSENKSEAEAAALEVAWEVLGRTTPEGRLIDVWTKGVPRAESVGAAARLPWWKGNGGPVRFRSYDAFVAQWHYQNPIWGPAVRALLEAAEAAHKGWLARQSAVRRLRLQLEREKAGPEGRQRGKVVGETGGRGVAVRKITAQKAHLPAEG